MTRIPNPAEAQRAAFAGIPVIPTPTTASNMGRGQITVISSNNKLSEQLRRLKQEKARLLDTDSDDLADRTRDLMDALEDGPDFLDSFDAELFDALVEKIIVDSNERLRFRLKNDLELTEQIERTSR